MSVIIVSGGEQCGEDNVFVDGSWDLSRLLKHNGVRNLNTVIPDLTVNPNFSIPG